MRAAFLLPISAFTRVFDALWGEKDRLRGFGRWSLILKLPNPSPHPLPSGERETTAVVHVTFVLTYVLITVTVQSSLQ
jgi:hypothetical protein